MNTRLQRQFSTISLWVTGVSCCALIGATAFYWDIVDIFSPFIAPILALGVWLYFGVSGAFALIVWVWQRKSHFVPRASAVALHLLTLLLVLSVPFHTIMRDLNFRRNYDSRMHVITMIERRQLAPQATTEEMVVPLPESYRHLSRGGGEVIVERLPTRTLVFFYTYRGVTDNVSGFMYRSDISTPEENDLGGPYSAIEKLRDHWYWVAAT